MTQAMLRIGGCSSESVAPFIIFFYYKNWRLCGWQSRNQANQPDSLFIDGGSGGGVYDYTQRIVENSSKRFARQICICYHKKIANSVFLFTQRKGGLVQLWLSS